MNLKQLIRRLPEAQTGRALGTGAQRSISALSRRLAHAFGRPISTREAGRTRALSHTVTLSLGPFRRSFGNIIKS